MSGPGQSRFSRVSAPVSPRHEGHGRESHTQSSFLTPRQAEQWGKLQQMVAEADLGVRSEASNRQREET